MLPQAPAYRARAVYFRRHDAAGDPEREAYARTPKTRDHRAILTPQPAALRQVFGTIHAHF